MDQVLDAPSSLSIKVFAFDLFGNNMICKDFAYHREFLTSRVIHTIKVLPSSKFFIANFMLSDCQSNPLISNCQYNLRCTSMSQCMDRYTCSYYSAMVAIIVLW